MRVMIVDDEKLIRDGLAKLVDWRTFGCEVVAEAADGVQALEYMQDHGVDLVFTDIRMPRLDGMELARQLRKKQPSIKFVFVSGYDDFALVRQALQMGACDYLLKPLDPDVLRELLTRLGRESEAAPALTPQELERLNQDARIAWRHRAQKALRRVVLDNRPPNGEEVDLLTPAPGIACRLIVAEMDRFYERYADLSAERLGLMQDSLTEELQVLCGGESIAFPLGEGRYGLCLYGEEAGLDEAGRELIRRLARLPKSGNRLICFDGGQTQRPDALGELYERAMRAREARFSPTEAASPGSHDDRLSSAVNAVLDAVRLGDEMLLEQRLGELEAIIAGEGERSFLYAQVNYANLYAQAIRYVADTGGSISEIFNDPMGEYRAVYNGQNLEDASRSMLRILSAIADYLRLSQSGDTATQIRKAKRYIDNHLGDSSLSMQKVADEFAMSASYFSTEFRKNVGYTFTEYLMMARIQRAGELLRHSKLKIYEVAESLGYENTTYFSTLFKRQYGVTPKQYRGER